VVVQRPHRDTTTSNSLHFLTASSISPHIFKTFGETLGLM